MTSPGTNATGVVKVALQEFGGLDVIVQGAVVATVALFFVISKVHEPPAGGSVPMYAYKC